MSAAVIGAVVCCACLGYAILFALLLSQQGAHNAIVSESLRIPLTDQENVNGTARLVVYSANANPATLTLFPANYSLHFQRTGNIASFSLETDAGSRLAYDNVGFSLDNTGYVALYFVQVPGITRYLSTCRGSFGNRLFFSVGNYFSNNNAGLLQSLGGPDNFIVFYHVAPGSTYPIPWDAGGNFIPFFSISYGAPNANCPAPTASHSTVQERFAALFSLQKSKTSLRP